MTALSVIAPNADVRETPDIHAQRGKLETQLVFGEQFLVESEKKGWCKGRCAHDSYEGWVEKRFLAPAFETTHIVTAAHSQLYSDATMKSPCLGSFSFGSLVAVEETGESFSRITGGAWLFTKHLSPASEKHEDYIATAQTFLETPYYWGGRSGFGIDCSGLVQVALGRAGIKCPRDTEQQLELGEEAERPGTGDLVFFKGHVGLLVDPENILHANAHHMKTIIEPLSTVKERSKGITAIRRI